MTAYPFYRSYSIATGSGTTQAGSILGIPSHGHLKYVNVLTTGNSTGPIWVKPVYSDQQGPWYALGNGGFVRSDANYGGSDSYQWSGSIPLEGFTAPLGISLYARNDTGSTQAVQMIAIVEVP